MVISTVKPGGGLGARNAEMKAELPTARFEYMVKEFWREASERVPSG
jgi:hypothetical protein